MLFSSGTLGRFSTILTGTLANPSMYCSGHNNLPPLRLPREGKLIIPETFKLFPDISYNWDLLRVERMLLWLERVAETMYGLVDTIATERDMPELVPS